MEETAKIAIHMVPHSSMSKNKRYDLHAPQSHIREVREINGKSTTPWINLHGWIMNWPKSSGNCCLLCRLRINSTEDQLLSLQAKRQAGQLIKWVIEFFPTIAIQRLWLNYTMTFHFFPFFL